MSADRTQTVPLCQSPARTPLSRAAPKTQAFFLLVCTNLSLRPERKAACRSARTGDAPFTSAVRVAAHYSDPARATPGEMIWKESCAAARPRNGGAQNCRRRTARRWQRQLNLSRFRLELAQVDSSHISERRRMVHLTK